MSGRRASDRWKTRLVLAGAVLQVVLFVLNIIAATLFLRTWAALEESVTNLREITGRRLEEPQVKPWGM